jgi:DNA-binding response OmpR family regulator
MQSTNDGGGGAVSPFGASILVVCDQPDVAELTVRALESRGFEMDRSDSVDDAVIRMGMREPRFAAAIIDLAGGAADAVALLERMRGNTDAELATTRVVISTWRDENRIDAWQAGADGFVVRPYHLDQLLELLYGAMARTGVERAEFRQKQMQTATGS